jgi:hypothetical protein
MPLPKKNIISGDTLEKCAFLLNMREWANSFESMDPTSKSKYLAKWMLDLIMHGIITYEWPTKMRDKGELHLRGMEWPHSSITGAYLEDIQGYQKGQYDH